MDLHHDGTFGVCCNSGKPVMADGEQDKHNIKNMTISQWYSSEYMRKVRVKMLGDEKLSACDLCYRDESIDNESSRIVNNWRSIIFTKQSFDRSFEQSPHYEIFSKSENDGAYDGMPLDLHIDMGNECNLACKFCKPAFSTTIGSKYKKWGILSKEDSLRTNWMDDDDVWYKFLNELLNIKNLKSVHFMGGEPTMSPRLMEFLDFFIDNERTNFAISFVTNGTFFSQELIDKMKRFTRADIDISIESILDNMYYIRQGLKKEKFTANLKLFMDARGDNFYVCLKPAISALNAPTYPELIEFFLENNILTESNIVFNPEYLRVEVLPLEIRKLYIPKFEALLKKLDNLIGDDMKLVRNRHSETNLINLHSELNSVYNMMLLPDPENAVDLRKELVYWLSKWDSEYNHDARIIYPEWADFLNSYDYKKVSN